MNNNSASYRLAKKAIQKLLQVEAEEWPPVTLFAIYQPHRPEEALPKAEEK